MGQHTLKITAYIPCHNNESTVAQAAAALRRQSRPADEYLFINDRCTDQSPAIARAHGFDVINVIGKGLAAGRNTALRHCSGDILVGLDADAEVEADFIEQLELCFSRHPTAAAVGGCLKEKYTDTPADLWRSVHMPQHSGESEIINPRMLYGSTLACRTAIVRGFGFNEQYISNFEDRDLCQRLRDAGHFIVYTPMCRAWHLRRDAIDSVLNAFWNWNYFGFENDVLLHNNWFDARLPLIWSVCQQFLSEDRGQPQLLAIDLLLPWGWTLRDLAVIQKKVGKFGDISTLIPLATEVMQEQGAPEKFVRRLASRLNELCRRLEAAGPYGPLDQNLVGRIRKLARLNIPDNIDWSGFEQECIL